MRAEIQHVTITPFEEYAVVVHIHDGEECQIYRVNWAYAIGQCKYGINDKGDPRRALGLALQDLGRSLELSHLHPLVLTQQTENRR